MAVKRLRKDVKLYDWIAAEERQNKSVFRIYEYEGHIMFAVPRKQYAKLPSIQNEQRQHIKLPKATGWTIMITTSYRCIKSMEIVSVTRFGSNKIDRIVLYGLVSVSIMI